MSELILHFCCILFMLCETMVCWIMKPRNFRPSQWVWHVVAVVQAANVAIWFDSLLKEAYHRIYDNSGVFDSFFSFCNTTSANRSNDTWCSDSSIAAKWFVWSSPFLFPVTLEFALLVSETLLGKVIGGNADNDHENEPAADGARPAAADVDERHPLLQHGNENPQRAALPSHYANSCYSKILYLISLIINLVYLVLTILLLVGFKLNGPGIASQLQAFDDAFAVYSVIYDAFSIICCAVGIMSCRKFRRPHLHTSFLEYLLLLATAGVLLQSVKRIAAFVSHNNDTPLFAVYVAMGVLDMVQSLSQIAFYYFAKDVKLQPHNNGGPADKASWVAVFKACVAVTSVTNLFIWISDSFLLPEILPGITPTNYEIKQWSVFDNAVTPVTIFFRFNSAMLFWCIGTDVFREGELHQD